MVLDKLPVLSLADDKAHFAQEIGNSFKMFGFALVKDFDIDRGLIARAWKVSEQFFALPEAEKRALHNPAIAGARGYTPFGVEIAKDAKAHDLKEFWHVGRDLPAGSPLADASMPPNVWPARPDDFREVFSELYRQFDATGATILSRIALYLGLDEHWFDPAIEDGNSVMRLLHYPPLEGIEGEAIRAGAHGDINLITLLLGAEEAGLELLTKQGTWLDASPPEGALVINVGDMLERLTNHMLPSTIHRVRNPDAARARFSRYSMPYFLHLRSDFPITTLPQCVTPENPDRYPDAILADHFLQQRLVDIGLKKKGA
ncbi:2-oxoglutarate and iron-dependent oxygenase domain-containing protein [Novosphingobium sp.]|uniref:isopenicillin N synthase family dioxygenase n=1 Tax=Novosphingobium sp. TaxID=1874826 RepID=UPI00286A856B|nr:2-oxoglutarate and iron-dependent oxygenase domain-containing protein [Novosphingobium sp.]